MERETLLRMIGKACLMASDLLGAIESYLIDEPQSPDASLKWLIKILISHADTPTTNDVLARAHSLWFESLSDSSVAQAFRALNLGGDYDELFRSDLPHG
jgi:hypothetical protein